MLHRTKKERDINRDKWIGVGGKFEEGESPEECLVREVFEETGYELLSWRFRAVITFVYGEVTEQMFLYTSDDFTGTEKVCDEGDLEWIKKEDILKLPLWEGDKIFLRRLWDDAPFFTMKLGYDDAGRLTKRAYREKSDKPYLTFPTLDRIPWIINAFSTRRGGVSGGIYSSMNLSYTVGDDPEKVLRNFRIIGEAMGVPEENMVLVHQAHTVNVMPVKEEHRGMGVVREGIRGDVDGIMTDVAGVCLVTNHADCVPLYFVDTVNHAIALSHSGWKGTVGNICRNTVEAMGKYYGTDPKDITAFIGPSIGGECYEVGDDVADPFREAYGEEKSGNLLREKGEKYLLDLALANYYNMADCGIPPENIGISDICTCCCKDWLHSHRGSAGRRGGNSAFLMIK